MATEPNELTEDWMSTLEMEKIAPWMPAGSPTRTICSARRPWMRSFLSSTR